VDPGRSPCRRLWAQRGRGPLGVGRWAFGTSDVAEHWDGASWHRVKLPTPTNSAAPSFWGAGAVSSDDIRPSATSRPRTPRRTRSSITGTAGAGSSFPARPPAPSSTASPRSRARRLGGRRCQRLHPERPRAPRAHPSLERQGVEAGADAESGSLHDAGRLRQQHPGRRLGQLVAGRLGGRSVSQYYLWRTASADRARSCSTGTRGRSEA
jgi:hypothetical protein